MNFDITEKERDAIRHALEVYLSDLRGEIVKTEKHEWKVGLREEKGLLQEALQKLSMS